MEIAKNARTRFGINAKIIRKVPFQYKEIMVHTKFHIKIRTPYFKLRKALFKMDLKTNGKNKKLMEFDVEKDQFLKKFLVNKDNPFKYVGENIKLNHNCEY